MQLAETDYTSTFQGGDTCVVLNNTAIESSNFSGNEKCIPWCDVSEAAIKLEEGKVCLVLRLGGSSINRYGFFSLMAEITRVFTLTTRNRILLDLTDFSEPTREKLLNSVHFHVLRTQESSVDEDLLAEIVGRNRFVDRIRRLAPRPWMTYCLVIANVVSYALPLLFSDDFHEAPIAHVLASLGIIAAGVRHGEWWRILTSFFVHGSVACITIDLAMLCFLGPVLERIYGRALFLLIYFGSAAIGNATSVHFAAWHGLSAGASGAIFGLCGAMTAIALRQDRSLPRMVRAGVLRLLWGFIFVSMTLGMFETEFDMLGHAGGLLGGFLIALILPERLDMEFYRRVWMRRAIAATALAALLSGSLAIIVKPATEPVTSAALLLRYAGRYMDLTKALQQQKQDMKDHRLTYSDVDEQNRSIYIPAFRKLSDDLSKIEIAPDDPKERFRSDLRRMAALTEKLLSLKTRYEDDTSRPEPADKAQADQIRREIFDLTRYFNKGLDAVKRR